MRGGGGVPADSRALALAFGVLGGFDKMVQVLADRAVVSRRAARKTMHMGAGPLFLCCWPLFSEAEAARYWAVVGPAAPRSRRSRRAAASSTTRGPSRP